MPGSKSQAPLFWKVRGIRYDRAHRKRASVKPTGREEVAPGKEANEPELLHALQLAKWALHQGKVELRNDNLEGNLDSSLYHWKPENPLAILDVKDDLPPKDLIPLQLALWLLDYLDSRLYDQVEGYSSGLRSLPVNVLLDYNSF